MAAYRPLGPVQQDVLAALLLNSAGYATPVDIINRLPTHHRTGIYTALSSLESRGLVTWHWGKREEFGSDRCYRLTEAGALAAQTPGVGG